MTEPAKETVIIVHGTFAAPKPGVSRWYHPGQCLSATKGFIAKLDAALQERGSQARCWAHCDQDDQGFYWSGNNSWVARSLAAAELGSYVLDLRNKGWCCHIVAHSHGGNVVLEALQQITTSLPSSAPLGKIATLGTPFMDTIAPILQRISRTRRLSVGLSWIALVWLMLLIPIAVAFNALGFDAKGTTIGTIIAFLAPAIGFTLFTFGRKSQTEPICCPLAQEQSQNSLLSAVGGTSLGNFCTTCAMLVTRWQSKRA
jgi:hypothetical protein